MQLPKLKNYYIDSVLGQGGTAIVYDGVDLRSGQRVAIKALYNSRFKDIEVRKKFKEEANRYLYLSHKNIASLIDFIIENDAHYLVMEYIEGKNLEEYINTISGPIPESETIRLFIQVLEGIAHAHHNRVFHLDIKPSNIMIYNNYQDVKVLDFGISAKKEDLTNLKKRMGSPMYMSPEQIDLTNVDWRSDIYSLGITLYQMLTANVPYKTTSNLYELFNLIKTAPLPKAEPKGMGWKISEQMQNIIARATAKNPDDRFQSCEEFQINLLQLQ